MDRAIVFTAQQFLGFELCKGLLEKGFEVTAVEHKDMINNECEDKWLEIGRNANLSYQLMNEKIELCEQTSICFVPIYDLFVEKDEKLLNRWIGRFKEIYDELKSNIKLIVLISPSQFLLNFSNRGDKIYYDMISDIFNIVRSRILEFYVPTIYGPWQPNSFLFQQIISRMGVRNYIDDCQDAIYIEDAIQTILQNIDKDLYEEKILLKSEKKDLWEKCIHFLNYADPFRNKDNQRQLNYTKLINVKENTSYEEGLKKQIDCNRIRK
ncbi:hypothetical protein ACQKP0_11620 [Heyndrickxia sp. NPDC080065]|uniref:hypothetical protein n=1 Tax=Heyndrickxia sp. NPDC080065 TaxID=3390568 RepID=UPI003CFF75F3